MKWHVSPEPPDFPLSCRVPVRIPRNPGVCGEIYPCSGDLRTRIENPGNPQKTATEHGYTVRKQKNKGVREEHAFLKAKSNKLLETGDAPW